MSDLLERIAKALEADAEEMSRLVGSNYHLAEAARTLLPEAAKGLSQLRAELKFETERGFAMSAELTQLWGDLKITVDALTWYRDTAATWHVVDTSLRAREALAALTSREKSPVACRKCGGTSHWTEECAATTTPQAPREEKP